MSRLLLLAFLGGCTPTLVPCDPLASDEEDIALAEILGAGSAADGTVYVMDLNGDEGRVFVGEGGVLYRWRVDGSGEGNDGDAAWYVYLASLGDAQVTVGVQVEGGTTTMAVGGDERETFDDLVATGEVLTLLDEAEVLAMEVHNLPGDVEIEYYAEVEDGSRLLVTRPTDDWDYEDFRVFYGDGSALIEREVSDVLRARDGGSTTLWFDVDRAEYVAEFPIVSDGEDFAHGDATLDTGSGVLDLDWLDMDVATASATFTFTCIE